MDVSSAALVVIDMQNGFVNHHSRHVVPVVADLVARWSAAGCPVVFTRYFNYPDSPYERFFQWRRLQQPPETDIVPELAEAAGHAHASVDKTGYTLFTPEAAELMRRAGWTDLAFCGIATESCVLRSPPQTPSSTDTHPGSSRTPVPATPARTSTTPVCSSPGA
ncbi:hypothetical protein SCALM49S_00782 [Streptomyces californicus]